MADQADLAGEYINEQLAKIVQDSMQEAANMPPGVAGPCDLCGEDTPRLVGGACAPCRDRWKLP